jgi:vacuolar-type H+-ATPase subunit D/Vma8
LIPALQKKKKKVNIILEKRNLSMFDRLKKIEEKRQLVQCLIGDYIEENNSMKGNIGTIFKN